MLLLFVSSVWTYGESGNVFGNDETTGFLEEGENKFGRNGYLFTCEWGELTGNFVGIWETSGIPKKWVESSESRTLWITTSKGKQECD